MSPEDWTIGGITFDTRGWRLSASSPSSMTWAGGDGAELTLTRTTASDPIHPRDLHTFRQQQRAVAAATRGGIVSVEVCRAGPGFALETVTKRKAGMGFVFTGTFDTGTPSEAYHLEMKADEGQTTGLREATVSAQMWELGEVKLLPPAHPGASQAVEGWSHDPYDADCDDDALNSVTDDDRLDAIFPEHPLSRVRMFLRQVRDSIVVAGWPLNPVGGPGDATGHELSSARRLLSTATLRELLWKHGRLDLLQVSLQEALREADPTGDASSENVAHLLLLLASCSKGSPGCSKHGGR